MPIEESLMILSGTIRAGMITVDRILVNAPGIPEITHHQYQQKPGKILRCDSCGAPIQTKRAGAQCAYCKSIYSEDCG